MRPARPRRPEVAGAQRSRERVGFTGVRADLHAPGRYGGWSNRLATTALAGRYGVYLHVVNGLHLVDLEQGTSSIIDDGKTGWWRGSGAVYGPGSFGGRTALFQGAGRESLAGLLCRERPSIGLPERCGRDLLEIVPAFGRRLVRLR